MVLANSKNLSIPSFDIKINGSPLSLNAKMNVISIVVDEDVNLPSMFVLEFAGLNDQKQEIELLDDQNLLAIGNVVQVKLGYKDALVPLIAGEITSLEPEFYFSRPPRLIVRGYNRLHRLQRGRKTRTFLQNKDSDIASQIASEAGLTISTEDSQVTHDYLLQANQTDWEFLKARAHLINYEIFVEDKTLFFRPVGNAETAILTLTSQEHLLEFYPRLSAMGQVSEVAVQGWDVKEKKEILSTAQSLKSIMDKKNSGVAVSQRAFGNAMETVSDRPIIAQAEADQIAKAVLENTALNFITGEGICWGYTNLRAGKVIEIAGIGKRFSGSYYVTATSHRYGTRGYYTYFNVKRNAS
jgi:phage protein D